MFPTHNPIKYPKKLLWLIVLISLAGCGGLAGEPQIVATLAPRPTAVPETGYPPNPPDLSAGAQIFAANCVRCHGDAGRGDGELVLAGQIPEPPRDFTDPATIRDQTPIAWYDVISNGRLDKLMPPWNGSLSEQERWDVALYSYTLSYQSDGIAQGQQIWAANCAQCHGENGRGNPDGETNGGDVTGQELLAGLSDTALFDSISQGTANMPAFADTLTEDERWNVIAYNRTLSLANVEGIGSEVLPPPPATTPEVAPATTPEVEVASAAEVVGSVNGKVENGSAGAPIPPDLTVTLHIYDSQFNEQTSEDFRPQKMAHSILTMF